MKQLSQGDSRRDGYRVCLDANGQLEVIERARYDQKRILFQNICENPLEQGAWGANQHADIKVFAMLCSRQWMSGADPKDE